MLNSFDRFYAKILGRWWEPMNVVSNSVNVDWVVMIPRGDGDTLTLLVIIKLPLHPPTTSHHSDVVGTLYPYLHHYKKVEIPQPYTSQSKLFELFIPLSPLAAFASLIPRSSLATTWEAFHFMSPIAPVWGGRDTLTLHAATCFHLRWKTLHPLTFHTPLICCTSCTLTRGERPFALGERVKDLASLSFFSSLANLTPLTRSKRPFTLSER